MKQRRCHGCRSFYDVKIANCPGCATSPYPFNVHLRLGKLNSHLFSMAEGATNGQDKISAYQAAKEHVQKLDL